MNSSERDELMRKVLRRINVHFKEVSELHYQIIPRDVLLDKKVLDSLLTMKDALKTHYHSDMLSCLHSNSEQKQRFPAVCMVRQLLRANGMCMRPKLESMGYDRKTGKKRVKRYYVIMPLATETS